MKLITTIITFTILIVHSSLAEDKGCKQYDKLSKEYAKCNSLLLKNKTSEIKENTSNKTIIIKNDVTRKINIIKNKFDKSDLKKKLLKFKNSKSHKEYEEN